MPQTGISGKSHIALDYSNRLPQTSQMSYNVPTNDEIYSINRIASQFEATLFLRARRGYRFLLNFSLVPKCEVMKNYLHFVLTGEVKTKHAPPKLLGEMDRGHDAGTRGQWNHSEMRKRYRRNVDGHPHRSI